MNLRPEEIIATIYPHKLDLLYPGEELSEQEMALFESAEDDFQLELNYFDQDEQEDQLWRARTGLNEDSLCAAIETLIFMSEKPIPLTKIRKHIDEDIPLRVIYSSIERLQEGYETAHHGLRLAEVAEGYQFRTKATYSKFVQDLYRINSLVLSQTALEVLAIIAYKQPVSKTEVERIRGVDSSHIVRGLMDKRLVKVVGRSEEAGRPALYGTTPEFLEVFNLPEIDHLPPEHELEEMVTQGVGKISDIQAIVHQGDKDRFVFDEMDEIEELAKTIKAVDSDTEFTKSLRLQEKKRQAGEDGEAPMSAFDLLEEFIVKGELNDANEAAAISELPTSLLEPSVIKDLREGPFNFPEIEEEFEMIDLDTGEPIKAEEELEIEVELEMDSEQESEEIVEPVISKDEVIDFNSLKGDLESEAEDLAAALDEAFEKLTGEKLDSEELSFDSDQLAEQEEELLEKTEQAIQEAEELDIDLNFLQQNQDFEGEARQDS